MTLLKVGPSGQGQTLLAFLRDHVKDYPSVKSLKRAIDGKKCRINGRVETFSTHKVRAGDKVEIKIRAPVQELPLVVLFEDDNLIFYNKPAGRPSETLSEYILVHRLDKETSGVMVFAKNAKMEKALFGLFASRQVKKQYLALVDKKPAQKKWVTESYLGVKARYDGGVLMGSVSKEKGKKAKTTFTCLDGTGRGALILAEPVTGRTHQLRVHLKEKGHPVLGDWQYAKGFTSRVEAARHMLHAKVLSFIHPKTGEELVIEAPLFDDFLRAQKEVLGA